MVISALSFDTNEFVERIKSEHMVSDANICSTRDELHFTRSSRGCAWYFVCSENKILREDRCPDGLYFDVVKESCNWKDEVPCNIDNRGPSECPKGNGLGLHIIPHQYSCSQYSGKIQKINRNKQGNKL